MIERSLRDPATFRSALLRIAPRERDAWLDRVLELDEIAADGSELPRGCVPYLPCSVDVLLRAVDHAPVRSTDVFVEVGSGVGRASALVHLLTGASVVGIEIQPRLVRAARDLCARLSATRISCVEGDAAQLTGRVTTGSVYFLYCPFSGERLSKLLADLEVIARTRSIRVCCVDLPLPACPWLTVQGVHAGNLTIHRSTLHDPSQLADVPAAEEPAAP